MQNYGQGSIAGEYVCTKGALCIVSPVKHVVRVVRFLSGKNVRTCWSCFVVHRRDVIPDIRTSTKQLQDEYLCRNGIMVLTGTLSGNTHVCF